MRNYFIDDSNDFVNKELKKGLMQKILTGIIGKYIKNNFNKE